MYGLRLFIYNACIYCATCVTCLGKYWYGEGTDGDYGRDNFLKVRHPSRNRTEAQCSGSLNLAAPLCAELVCVAALSAHVSRWACVVAESVQSVPSKEEAVGGGHDAGQV